MTEYEFVFVLLAVILFTVFIYFIYQSVLEEKKEKEFQLSYETGEDLYLAKGYGRQMSGGYSIQVEELGESSNGIFFVTKLLGPEDLKEAGVPSYPCIVIKTRKQEKPVTFRESSSPVKKESEKGE